MRVRRAMGQLIASSLIACTGLEGLHTGSSDDGSVADSPLPLEAGTDAPLQDDAPVDVVARVDAGPVLTIASGQGQPREIEADGRYVFWINASGELMRALRPGAPPPDAGNGPVVLDTRASSA